MPTKCEGVPSDILDPASTWPSRDEYFGKYDALAARFIENFKLMMAEAPNTSSKPDLNALPSFRRANRI